MCLVKGIDKMSGLCRLIVIDQGWVMEYGGFGDTLRSTWVEYELDDTLYKIK